MSQHRASHRAARRRRRVGALSAALGVTIAVGGVALGVLPQVQPGPATAGTGALAAASLETASIDAVEIPEPTRKPKVETTSTSAGVTAAPDLPSGSGTGRRIVFDQSDQRVWLVNADQTLDRTYLVSGSRFDNLQPGTYSVLSRSRHAASFDYSGSLEYFVRFATGYSEPIGFHAVPRYNNGKLEQTKAQLGTPLSAGCVRQWMPDAIHLWDWAPIGTKVVVTA